MTAIARKTGTSQDAMEKFEIDKFRVRLCFTTRQSRNPKICQHKCYPVESPNDSELFRRFSSCRTDSVELINGMAYQVYILRCWDGTFYTGQTTDLDKRIAAHNRGTGARYTRGRGPVELVYHTGVPTLREAFLLEHKIKRMKRADKEKLIGGFCAPTPAST